MSVTVNINGQAAVGVTAGTGDTISVSVDNVADLVAVTLSPNGGPGPTGPQGPQGQPATTIEIGTVTTGAAGSSASITATTSKSGNLVTLDFTIPQGATGAAGATGTMGATGPAGPANKLTIGTVTTGEAGSSASATITGTAPSQVLNLTIPRGDTGASGGGGGGGAVTSVAGRTGAVVLTASDVSGLATIATSGSASDLASGTVPAARLPAATTKAVGAIQVGTGLSISSGVLSVSGNAVSWVAAPATPTSSGSVGQFSQDANWLYACYASSSWLRVARDPWILPPGPPENVTTSGSTSGSPGGSVEVSWDPPLDDGGEITGYTVQLDGGSPVSLGAATQTHTFNSVSFNTNACNSYTVSVRTVNSAGQSSVATAAAFIPQTAVPTIYSVNKVPVEGAPGVDYTVAWFQPCGSGTWNQFELQLRLYFNGSEVVVSGDEDGWEAGYSGANQSWSTTTASTSSQQYQFRVRAKNVSGGSVLATSGWSAVSTS